ncbi:EAL domain-containing protein [Egicoccus halophilus]|uniref:EAL domain-containing protein n=1 Tax=Egicoccus halophilus TaxID=1670830 RepID=A0A8J3A810_9ACTN|nr:EAL domain-containing protein [Egicoccus halophilus]GGI05959.1 hypothetical protein GCM10011354_16710 [Egicoccus halophilus]
MSLPSSLPRVRLGSWLVGRASPWLVVVGVGTLLGLAWLATYLAGGAPSTLPHAYYVAILVAAAALGPVGGAATGVLAGLLGGPLTPADVATGAPQPAIDWLVRGFFFVLSGALVGGLVANLRRSYEAAVADRFDREVQLSVASPEPPSAIAPLHEWQVRALLEQRDFSIVFQPLYALDDGRLVAVEALTRFHTDPPERPDVWFQRATCAGLGRDLELAAIDQALTAVAADGLPPDVGVNLNCSPQALADPRLPGLLGRTRRPVVFEITEHAMVEDYPALEAAMQRLREHGARFAVDDAGAGFASLRHIVRLAPEFIKLDMSLTQNLRADPVRSTLAACLLRFTNETGRRLVAEGIEHAADLAHWRHLGAHAAQGHHLGRPGPLPVPQHCPAIAVEADRGGGGDPTLR